MPNLLAHRKAREYIAKAPVPPEDLWYLGNAVDTYGGQTLLQLHTTIACGCLHEKKRTAATSCPWRQINSRCTHQPGALDRDKLHATEAFVAGSYVLRGLGESHLDEDAIRKTGFELAKLDRPIRMAYRLLLQDDSTLSDPKRNKMEGTFKGITTIDELEKLIEELRKPHADILDAAGVELADRFVTVLEIEPDWRPEPELVQVGLLA
jgi:hypothetical protein